ncbi:MAG: transporter substrate-binding domain-containing protein [Chloroflexaceae bacterium]|nr:transporter substrate-binding domain-containing protein [Chloroflexaceae bacterium]
MEWIQQYAKYGWFIAVWLVLSACNGTTPETILYQVQVQSQDSAENIENAQVTIEVNAGGTINYSESTDSNGVAVIAIDNRHAGQQARLEVSANGYQAHTQMISLIEGDSVQQLLQLEPAANSGTPGPGPTPPDPANPVSPTPDPANNAGILQQVQTRGSLRCGVEGSLPGFSLLQDDGTWVGFDVDFCRVIAAAVLGDAQAVEFIPLSTADDERFHAVQDGRVDVLLRNTTWTAERDTNAFELDFGPTTFHDGQGLLVHRNLNITLAEELQGKRICVRRGTTTEANLQRWFDQVGVDVTALPYDDTDQMYTDYEAQLCDAVTSDRSQLAAQQTTMAQPQDHFLLDVVMSREPLGPVFRENDNDWRDVVSWAIFATMYAEETHVSSTNVERLLTSSDTRIKRLLGVEGNIGANLGLDNNFAFEIIRQVGNYEEIYNRNLGSDTPINLPRGPNRAWNTGQGGVLSSPPF